MARAFSYNADVLTIGVRNFTGNMLNFERTTVEMDQAILREFKDIASYVHNEVHKRTPRRTGFLQDNLRLDYYAGGRQFEVGWLESDFTQTSDPRNRKRRYYAPFVEFGGGHTPAYYMLYEGYRAGTQGMAKEYRDAINEVIAKRRIR